MHKNFITAAKQLMVHAFSPINAGAAYCFSVCVYTYSILALRSKEIYLHYTYAYDRNLLFYFNDNIPRFYSINAQNIRFHSFPDVTNLLWNAYMIAVNSRYPCSTCSCLYMVMTRPWGASLECASGARTLSLFVRPLKADEENAHQ